MEAGNITRAAEQLYVAQPALGLQIRQLEQDLGVPLLVRHSRGVSATQAGKVLYERARDILRAVEDARREVASFGGAERERLSVGLTPGIVKLLGADVLVEARESLPEVHLSFIEEMSYVLIDALEREELDLALASEVAESPNLVRLPVLEEEMLLVSGPGGPGLDAAPIAFAEVLRRPLVLAGERDAVRQLVASAAERMALPLDIAFEASSVGMMKEAVAGGAACSVMPYGSVVQEIRSGQLTGRRITDPQLRRTLYLVRPARRAPFRNEAAILAFAAKELRKLTERLGPLARPLPALQALGQTARATPSRG